MEHSPLLKLPGVLSFESEERKEVETLMAQQGTVRWFSEEKGYGFIEPDDRGEDLFVHYTAIEGSGFRSLQEGERVIYEAATQGRKGPQVQIVRKAGSPR